MDGKNVLSLLSPRVWRTYRGGKKIDKWHGTGNPSDGEYPEEWLFSTVDARNPVREEGNGSLSRVKAGKYAGLSLKEIIDSEPEKLLGINHYERFGSNPGILVKLIDTVERLSIQVHPDRQAASKYFNSCYGKTEAWYVIGGREINHQKPHIYLGFKEGITRNKWQELFENQDIHGMLECLHKIDVKTGEVYYIEGGVPHAIGPGCFLLEIQEPTDFTIRVELTSPQGLPLQENLCHQGIGFKNIFECFHYCGLSLKETIDKWQIPGKIVLKKPYIEKSILLDEQYTFLFKLCKIRVTKAYRVTNQTTFSAIVILSGSGSFYNEKDYIEINRGDSIFISNSVKEYYVEATSGCSLEIICCYPPKSDEMNQNEEC